MTLLLSLMACFSPDPCDSVIDRALVEEALGRPLAEGEVFRYDGRGSCSARYGEGDDAVEVSAAWIFDDPADTLREERGYYDERFGAPEERSDVAVRALIYRAAPDPEAEAQAQACFSKQRATLEGVAAALDANPTAMPDLTDMPSMDTCLRLAPAKGWAVLAQRAGDQVTVQLPADEVWLERVLARL